MDRTLKSSATRDVSGPIAVHRGSRIHPLGHSSFQIPTQRLLRGDLPFLLKSHLAVVSALLELTIPDVQAAEMGWSARGREAGACPGRPTEPGTRTLRFQSAGVSRIKGLRCLRERGAELSAGRPGPPSLLKHLLTGVLRRDKRLRS